MSDSGRENVSSHNYMAGKEDESICTTGQLPSTEPPAQPERKKKTWRPPPKPKPLRWQEKVLTAIDIARKHIFREYEPKLDRYINTRFCENNIALFDHDEESKVDWKQVTKGVPRVTMDDSVNVISVNITQSDVGYPIEVFGTVLARDEADFKCVYLFRRGRDDPQVINSAADALTLTGPNRAFAVSDCMYFEFNLQIKDNSDNGSDKVLSKAMREYNGLMHRKRNVLWLDSKLSEVRMVYSSVPSAVEADISVNILKKGAPIFTGNVTAWTSRNAENKIVLYDSEALGTQTRLGDGGSVELTRRVVAVSSFEQLVLHVRVSDSGRGNTCFKVVLGMKDEVCTHKQGPYKLQVKIVWTGVPLVPREHLIEYFGRIRVVRMVKELPAPFA